MPELPEVETVRRSLELHLSGRAICSVGGCSIAMRRPLDVEALRAILPNRSLTDFRRRAKYLLIDFEPAGSLMVHLGMSGKLLIEDRTATPAKHTHLRLELDDGRELRFVDPRRFGFAHWLEPGDEDRDPSLCTLGPEPVAEDAEAVLPPRLKAGRSPVKTLLLNQRVVAGVGNIYANETLWRSGIHPLRRGDRISSARLVRLARHLKEVLEEAIARGGTTLKDYATPEGTAGYFALDLEAYGRGGLPCSRCSAVLEERAVGGRSTVWCPRCQR